MSRQFDTGLPKLDEMIKAKQWLPLGGFHEAWERCADHHHGKAGHATAATKFKM